MTRPNLKVAAVQQVPEKPPILPCPNCCLCTRVSLFGPLMKGAAAAAAGGSDPASFGRLKHSIDSTTPRPSIVTGGLRSPPRLTAAAGAPDDFICSGGIVVAGFISFALPKAGLIHCAASPLPTKPNSFVGPPLPPGIKILACGPKCLVRATWRAQV